MTEKPNLVAIERKEDTTAQDALNRALEHAEHADAVNAIGIIFLRDGSWIFECGKTYEASRVIGILERIKFGIMTEAQREEEE